MGESRETKVPGKRPGDERNRGKGWVKLELIRSVRMLHGWVRYAHCRASGGRVRASAGCWRWVC